MIGKLGKTRFSGDKTYLERCFAPENPLKANLIETVIVFDISKLIHIHKKYCSFIYNKTKSVIPRCSNLQHFIKLEYEMIFLQFLQWNCSRKTLSEPRFELHFAILRDVMKCSTILLHLSIVCAVVRSFVLKCTWQTYASM